MHRKLGAALAALILTLAVAPAALATDVSDSFSVNGTLTVTGIPASIDYGALDAGTTSGIQTIDATVSSNAPWTMTVTGTDFTGPGNLSKSVRQIQLSTTGGPIIQPGTFPWVAFDDAVLADATPDVTGSAGSGLLVRSELRVAVPANTPAGSYSGTITYTFSAS